MPLTGHSKDLNSKINYNVLIRKQEPNKNREIRIHGLDVKSLILLLSNEDDDILVQVLLHLDHVDNEQDMALLDNVQVLKRLLEILERSAHNECLRKLCLKLMTYLVKNDSGSLVFCNSPCLIQLFINILARTEDSTTLELCLYIVSVLTINKDHCNYLVCHPDIIHFLGNHVNDDVDIDIQYNCVKILENMMAHGVIRSRDEIPMLKIFKLFLHSGVERLQLSSLNILYKVTELQDPYQKYSTEMLAQLGSFFNAFDTADQWPYDDQKIVLLYLISTFPLQYFDITALKKLLTLMNSPDITPDELSAGIHILVKLCDSEYCQYHINMMDIQHSLVKYLTSENTQVSHVACLGVIILCERYQAYWQEISSDQAIFSHLFQVLTDENVDVECKARFCKLLHILMDNEACCNYITGKQDQTRSQTLNVTLKNDSEVKTSVLLDIAVGSNYDDLTTIILKCIHKLTYEYECIGYEQLDIILNYFHGSSLYNDLKSEVFLEIISLCLASPTFRELFVDLSGLPIVNDYMKNKSETKLLTTYGNLLINACKYSDLAIVINKLNMFQWMNKHHLCEQPIWHRAIFSLLNINLPLKFAYCNALDFIDITTEGFYVFKLLKHVNRSDFPDLDKILHEKNDHKVVYVFTRDHSVSYKDKFINKYISDITVFLRVANNIHVKELPESSSVSVLKVSNVEDSDEQSKQNVKRDLEIIATYVVNQMNGHGDDIVQSMHDDHLEEIIADHKSSVIPIGHVKIGLKFERCLLFKILCDVFGYPCALVRNEYDEDCYNRVSIACFEDSEHSTDNNETLAKDLTRRKVYTVDLMSNPARLIPISTKDTCLSVQSIV